MRITAFGGYSFQMYESKDNLNTAPQPGWRTDLINGGAFDSFGQGQSVAQGYTLTVTRVVLATTETLLDAAIDSAKAIVGARGNLSLTMGDTSTRTLDCRCVQCTQARTRENLLQQELTWTFEVITPGWVGTSHTLSGTFTVASGVLQSFTLANNGNRNITNPVITITAGASSAVTGLVFAGYTGATLLAYFQFNTTIPAGQALAIDCGAQSVLLNGVANYNGIQRLSGHILTGLMRVDCTPATAVLQIVPTFSGANKPLYNIVTADGWK